MGGTDKEEDMMQMEMQIEAEKVAEQERLQHQQRSAKVLAWRHDKKPSYANN